MIETAGLMTRKRYCRSVKGKTTKDTNRKSNKTTETGLQKRKEKKREKKAYPKEYRGYVVRWPGTH